MVVVGDSGCLGFLRRMSMTEAIIIAAIPPMSSMPAKPFCGGSRVK